MTLTGKLKLTAPETIGCSRDMVGAHQNLNGLRDLFCFLFPLVQTVYKSTKKCGNYSKKQTGAFFMEHGVCVLRMEYIDVEGASLGRIHLETSAEHRPNSDGFGSLSLCTGPSGRLYGSDAQWTPQAIHPRRCVRIYVCVSTSNYNCKLAFLSLPMLTAVAGGIVYTAVCQSVYCMISQKLIKLLSPNLTYNWSTMSPGNSFILGKKGKGQVHDTHSNRLLFTYH